MILQGATAGASGPGIIGEEVTAQNLGAVTLTVTFKSDGSTTATASAGSIFPSGNYPTHWIGCAPSGVGSGYWIRFGGSFFGGGPLNTWLQLSSDRSVTLTRSSSGTTSDTLVVDIAEDSSGTVIRSSKSIDCHASFRLF